MSLLDRLCRFIYKGVDLIIFLWQISQLMRRPRFEAIQSKKSVKNDTPPDYIDIDLGRKKFFQRREARQKRLNLNPDCEK